MSTSRLITKSLNKNSDLEIYGGKTQVTLPDGQKVDVVQLNNAATTPPLASTMETVNECMKTYGALHRGAGPRARITYQRVQDAIESIRQFMGADDDKAIIFTENTSAAINTLARLIDSSSEDVIFTSEIEHTSNNLPWLLTSPSKMFEIKAKTDGSLDMDDLERMINKYKDRLKLIAISGASNMTGHIPDMKQIAKMAHDAGALLFVDAAQLAPHRPINMQEIGIDAMAFSAHKVYAPFGLGVLAVPKDMLARSPVSPGGGSIDMISDNGVIWAPAAERHQTGTWNVTGIIATGTSCKVLSENWDTLVSHEKDLCNHIAERLPSVPGVTMYVPPECFKDGKRVGAVAFNLEDYHHALLAAILDHEYAIEVRAGTICNHKLVRRWSKVDNDEHEDIERRISKECDRLASYGIVRASFGFYNTIEDVDRLIDALNSIVENGPKLKYQPLPKQETYEPVK